MHFHKVFALSSFLVGGTLALVANFDQSSVNLANYMSGNFTQFLWEAEDKYYSEDDNMEAQSKPNFIQATGGSGTVGSPATGTLLLNSHAQYGHLSSYYIGCYTPQAFATASYACNYTMVASCYTLNNTINVFTLKAQYLRSDNMLALVNLTSFYSYYAGLGYFPGTGTTAKCTKYVFNATPTKSGANQFNVNFYLDTMTYTVTT